MTLPAILFRDQLDDDRGHERHRIRLGSVRAGIATKSYDLTVHDVSASGILLETDQNLSAGLRIAVEFSESLRRQARIVWASNQFYGAKFTVDLSPAELRRIYSASDVIWPNFRPGERPVASSLWQDRDKFNTVATAGCRNNSDVWRHDGADKLPLSSRLKMIVGMAALPWAIISGGLWLALA
ncbi:PilZ domain-containing protein [Pleurocapsales cyanobacterium LEGE 06147]|nr:PilZ domain-containing protein [Pleurocapsales cyanobacterium LEGE 06147]